MSDLLYSRAMAPPSERSVTAMRRDACLPRPPIDTTVPPDEPQSGGGSALRASFVERLLRTGIERDLAASILEACGSQLSEIRLAAEIVRRLVLAPTLPIGAGARVALVGPTGVGKTTTLAKLAATYALSGRRVALISTDTQRIGGAAQIQMYARMIGVPVEVIDSAGEMADAVARNASRDLVLIDTVGRNPRHDAHLGEIRELLDAAAPVEVHLTLAAPCGLRYLLDAAERFASLGASRLILTKLDEMPSWGLIPTLVERTGLPVSFLADGQDVPRHIQPANAGEIVAQILGSR